jgi:hypothetical protein
VFGDGGFGKTQHLLLPTGSHAFVDAGVGLRLRGRFYDRAVDLRIDAPLLVNDPFGSGSGISAPETLRFTFDWR